MELNHLLHFLPLEICFYINKILINDNLWNCRKSLQENLLFYNPYIPFHPANAKIIDELIIRICKDDPQLAIKIFGTLYYLVIEKERVPFWISEDIKDKKMMNQILHYRRLLVKVL